MDSFSGSVDDDLAGTLPAIDTTFKTAYDYTDDAFSNGEIDKNDLKLPNLVNFVALRETFLSEAPFVKRSTRPVWKRWIDSRQFTNMLAASLTFVSDCVGDNGSIDIKRLNIIHSSITMQKFALNVADMMVTSKYKYSNTNDILFKKLPELLCYMIVNGLISCTPKHSRVYNSVRFREILLDWLTEMIGGIRLTHGKVGREWIFADANDSNIMVYHGDKVVTGNNNNSSTDSKGKSGTNKNDNSQNLGAAISSYNIENSPLIDMYFKIGRTEADTTPAYQCMHGVRARLSHLPERPIISLNPDAMTIPGQYRNKKVDSDVLKTTLRETSVVRKEILSEYGKQKQQMSKDLSQIRRNYRVQMSLLRNKPVSKRQMILLEGSKYSTINRADSAESMEKQGDTKQGNVEFK